MEWPAAAALLCDYKCHEETLSNLEKVLPANSVCGGQQLCLTTDCMLPDSYKQRYEGRQQCQQSCCLLPFIWNGADNNRIRKACACRPHHAKDPQQNSKPHNENSLGSMLHGKAESQGINWRRESPSRALPAVILVEVPLHPLNKKATSGRKPKHGTRRDDCISFCLIGMTFLCCMSLMGEDFTESGVPLQSLEVQDQKSLNLLIRSSLTWPLSQLVDEMFPFSY
ncbi:uncharacterized protein LOC118167734 isoform X2 [Oxyura jamaicensis]|uniref:uncharacterized protein LOC118167734 isoform X2 n=1 Tax=Oxyura jamaicensis TaxID=8884 RepID=UPI0015A52148|nr:uncharacterized protein LOC118167734 isoform X2 [Oxyura jamaicensis]